MEGPSIISQSRAIVLNKYGKNFADKASDDLCLTLAAPPSAFMEAATLAPRPSGQSSAIIEFTETTPTVAEAEKLRGNTALWEKLKSVLSETNSIIPTVYQAEQVLRQARVVNFREACLKSVNAVTEHVEKSISQLYSLRKESLADSRSITRVCWLNQSVQTLNDPFALAEVASHPTIKLIDVPRKLVAEIDRTGPLLQVPQYRTSFKKTGKGIIVAVIDSEVALNHPNLKDRVVQRRNFTQESWGNPNAHGTAVAGIIASDHASFTGMAPEATIYNYKVLATNSFLNGTDFEGALAVQQALEDGAHLANCSWGAGQVGTGTSREARACDNAWDLGLIIIKSAGNNGPDGFLTTPADARGVIVVGATDKTGKMMQAYSSRGTLPHLTDPDARLNLRPHLVAPGGAPPFGGGNGIVSCQLNGAFADCTWGTSFAAPHVTGLLALLLEADPNLTPDQLRMQLIDKMTTLMPGVPAVEQGSGLISMKSLIPVTEKPKKKKPQKSVA